MIIKTYRPIIMVMVILFLSTINVYAATIIVDSTADISLPNNDGNCTLREAIAAAESNAVVDGCVAGSGADTIEFDPAILPGAIVLQAGNLSDGSNPISESLSIDGPGADELAIDGDSDYSVFYFNSPPGSDDVFTVRGLQFYQSVGSIGPVIRLVSGDSLFVSDIEATGANESTSSGGVISFFSSDPSNRALVEIERSHFSGNLALSSGGAISVGPNSTTIIRDSTFISNGSHGTGGAINVSSSGELMVTRSTFSENRSGGAGGAINTNGTENIEIMHSTIVNNEADSDLSDVGAIQGGGIHLGGANSSVTLSNTIVANNFDKTATGDIPSDIQNAGVIITNGFNFIGVNTLIHTEFPVGFPNANNDYVGTSASPIDPGLDALADNGGPTQTHLPNVGSEVHDNGFCTGEKIDQRGFTSTEAPSFTRIVDYSVEVNGPGSDGCDIGAVEAGAFAILGERYDINNDGKADLLWRNDVDGRNIVWFMNGSDKASLGLPKVTNNAWQVKGVGDTDGDGRSDILWRNMTDGRNQIWKMIDGGKQTGSIATISDLNWELVGSDDFDGNGTDDILWRHALDGRNTIYFMDGFNATSTSITSISNLDWQVAGTGDIDGDDKADIFWRNQATGQNTVWLMDGANNASNNLTTIADTNLTVQGIGDLNDDGLDDIVWRDAVTRSVTAWLMQPGLTEDQQNISASSGSNFEIELVGDLGGDGKADIVWRDQVNGTNILWQMDGVIKTSSSIQKVGDTDWKIMP